MAISKAMASTNIATRSPSYDNLGKSTKTIVIAAPFAVFPVKLHQMLNDAEESGNGDIVSWLPDGKSFKIHDRARFVRLIMPSYFGASKFRSFQRNLNLWNFTAVNNFPKKGNVSHPRFIRNCPDLCETMQREKVKNKTPPPSVLSEPRQDAARAVAEPFSATQSSDDLSWGSLRAQARPVQYEVPRNSQATGLSGGWPFPILGSENPAPSSINTTQQQVVQEVLRKLVFGTSTASTSTEEALARLHLLRAPLSPSGNALSPVIASLLRQPGSYPARGI
jgi:hypothetical protein